MIRKDAPMVQRKRGSRVLECADRRAASLQSISPTLDLSSGLTLAAYQAAIQDIRSQLVAYNAALSAIDKARDDINQAERSLRDLSEHMLMGVAVKYSKSSQEYLMAGGVRKGDTRRKLSRTSGVAGAIDSQKASTNGHSSISTFT